MENSENSEESDQMALSGSSLYSNEGLTGFNRIRT